MDKLTSLTAKNLMSRELAWLIPWAQLSWSELTHMMDWTEPENKPVEQHDLTNLTPLFSRRIRFAPMQIVLTLSTCVQVDWENPNSYRSRRSQIISQQTEEIALYSSLVEDLEILFLLLHFHEIIESPRDILQPIVERHNTLCIAVNF